MPVMEINVIMGKEVIMAKHYGMAAAIECGSETITLDEFQACLYTHTHTHTHIQKESRSHNSLAAVVAGVIVSPFLLLSTYILSSCVAMG